MSKGHLFRLFRHTLFLKKSLLKHHLKIKIMSSGKVLLGVLAGVAAGAMLGILFAPEKGSDTRKKISKKGEDYVDTLKEKFNVFLNNASDKFEKIKEDVSEFAEKVHSNPEEIKRGTKTTTV